MKSILDFYGLGDQPQFSGDGQTVSTADFLPAYQRENQYQNSMFGKVANWLEGKKKGLEDATMFNPVVMGLEGLGTMNRWMGASQYPEKIEPVDVLAPLGLSAMAAPFMPRLPTMASRDAAVAKSLHATSPQMPERLPLRSAPSEMQTPGNLAGQFDDWESMFLGQSANTNAPRNFSDLFKPKDGATTTVTNAYDAYARFARENGEKAESLPTFSRIMQDLGYPVQRIAGQTRFIGIEPAIFSDTTRSSLPGTIVNALDERGAVGSAGGKLASGALDMSHEARMQRAREMGFDNPWWRGDSSDFNEFDAAYMGTKHGTAEEPDAIGVSGFDFTRSKPLAEWHADGGVTRNFLVKEFDKDGSPRVFALDDLVLFEPDISERLSRLGIKIDDKTTFADVIRMTGGGDSAREALMSSGVAGVYHNMDKGYANGDTSSVRIFDPRNIRSVNAAFDPAKADSANLLAADQARASLPGTVVNALEDGQDTDSLNQLLRLYGYGP